MVLGEKLEKSFPNASSSHSQPEWNIGNENYLAWNTDKTYNFCIPLDFLDTKDLKKIQKGQTQSPKSKIL